MILQSLIHLLSPWQPPDDYTNGVIQGILAACACVAGIYLIKLFPKWQWHIATLLLIGITPLAIGGFWFSSGVLGISDWDYYFSYHHTIRESILTYHVFPFWNPYTCGGTAGLADPEFPLLGPTFLLELIFGIPNGLRLVIYAATATYACGMLHLSRRLGLTIWGAFIAALIVAFSSVNLLENVEGHQNILAIMWIPWMFLHFYNAYHKKTVITSSSIWCAVFLSLIFYRGGIYLLMYIGLSFIAFFLAARKRSHIGRIIIFSSLIAISLSAMKFIPVALWLSEFQDGAYASSAFTLPYLPQILFGRYLHGAGDIIPHQGSGWHEYGAYIGIAAAILAGIGVVSQYRKRFMWILVIGAVVVLIISGSGPFLKPLFDQVSWLPRSNISRIILFAVIPLAYMAGAGTDVLTRHKKYGWIAGMGIVAVISLDLMTLSYPLSQQAFVLPDVTRRPAPAPSPVAYSAFEYKIRHAGADYTRAYAATRAGYGSLSYCSVLSPIPAVRTIHDKEGNDIISLDSPSQTGSYTLEHWDPNTVRISTSLPEETFITLNANYAKGWFANGTPAREKGNRVAALVPANTTEVTFYYKTPGFSAGASITILTILGLIFYTTRKSLLPLLNALVGRK